MLEFARREPVTKWNGWYLRMLAAEGSLFIGDKPKAAAEARAALAMAPEHVHPGIRDTDERSPRGYWRGLMTAMPLSTCSSSYHQYPMIGPAEITRDPLYALPLAGNARYQATGKELEAKSSPTSSGVIRTSEIRPCRAGRRNSCPCGCGRPALRPPYRCADRAWSPSQTS